MSDVRDTRRATRGHVPLPRKGGNHRGRGSHENDAGNGGVKGPPKYMSGRLRGGCNHQVITLGKRKQDENSREASHESPIGSVAASKHTSGRHVVRHGGGSDGSPTSSDVAASGRYASGGLDESDDNDGAYNDIEDNSGENGGGEGDAMRPSWNDSCNRDMPRNTSGKKYTKRIGDMYVFNFKICICVVYSCYKYLLNYLILSILGRYASRGLDESDNGDGEYNDTEDNSGEDNSGKGDAVRPSWNNSGNRDMPPNNSGKKYIERIGRRLLVMKFMAQSLIYYWSILMDLGPRSGCSRRMYWLVCLFVLE
ncbi:hypothetical protein Hanom_Chr04g00317181 [Helianthus anomalus]